MQSSFGSETKVVDHLISTGLKVRIETPLYQECRDFYTEYLGMKVLDSWDEKTDKGVILGLGSSSQDEAFLELGYTETQRPYEGISLQFRVRDVDAIAESLRGRLEFSGPVERPWGSRYLYLGDPAGIKIILFEGEL